MKKRHAKPDNYRESWYSLTANMLLMSLGGLEGEVNCDVCVVGGGFTGLSAAIELRQRGYSVVLLEAQTVPSGASGLNGGHIQRGFVHSPTALAEKYDWDTAKLLAHMSLEGLGLVIERVKKFNIKCDLKFGHLTAGLKKEHIEHLKHEIEGWEKVGLRDLKLLDKTETQSLVKTDAYIGGLYDAKGGHFHPLNYCLGLANAAQSLGVKIYEGTRVIEVKDGDTAIIRTSNGATVKAKHVILGGLIQVKGTEKLNRKVITATAHIIATEPIGETHARNIMSRDIAAIDANFIMNYYRFSSDHRLIFGGNCNYSDQDFENQDASLRKKMVKLFPSLAMTRIDNCWRGQIDITLNRLPAMGRIGKNIFYAHGYSGHGVVVGNLAGKLMAEAVAGTAERFDVLTRIKHAPFVGGNLLKRPLFVLGMTWFRMRDMLS